MLLGVGCAEASYPREYTRLDKFTSWITNKQPVTIQGVGFHKNTKDLANFDFPILNSGFSIKSSVKIQILYY